jgi:hypothetical protein
MQKNHLFKVVVLIGSLPWLHLLEVGIGIRWWLWFVIIQVFASLAYSLCKDDKKDKNSYFED